MTAASPRIHEGVRHSSTDLMAIIHALAPWTLARVTDAGKPIRSLGIHEDALEWLASCPGFRSHSPMPARA